MRTGDTKAPAAKKAGHGGARAGAGRKAAAHVKVDATTPALEFLAAVYACETVPMALRVKAAGMVVTATVVRPSTERELGKKARALLDAKEMLADPDCIFRAGRPPLHAVRP